MTHALPSRRQTRDLAAYEALRPDGRWVRILTALGEGPAEVGALLEATDQGKYPLWRERRKIRTALFDMADLGWVAATHWGWARTVDGTAALAEAATRPRDGGQPCAAA